MSRAKRKRKQKNCHCAAYPFTPHRHDWRRCIIPEDDGDDYAADHRADDPRRGQAAEINRMRRRPYE